MSKNDKLFMPKKVYSEKMYMKGVYVEGSEKFRVVTREDAEKSEHRSVVVPLEYGSIYVVTFPNKTDRLRTAVIDKDPRKMEVGDTAVIEAGILSGWSDVFPDEGERFLASFAIPGVPAGVRATNVAELEKSLSRRIAIAPDDSMEVKQIKSMVEGMKDELRDYIGQGGTVLKYRERLFERQKQEQAYYRLFKEEINAAAKAGKPEDEILRIWKSRNAELRSMGIKLVPLPDFAAK